MNGLLEALNTLSVSLIKNDQIETVTAFMKSFIESFELDNKSGKIKVETTSLKKSLGKLISFRQASSITKAFEDGFIDGYAIISANEPTPVLPWSFLKNYVLDKGRLIPPLMINDLGLMEVKNTDNIKTILKEKFVALPKFLNTDESINLLFSNIEYTRNALDKRIIGWLYMPKDGYTNVPGRDKNTPGHHTGSGIIVGGGSPAVILNGSQLIDCIFTQASWKTFPFIRMCLNKNCALGLAEAIHPTFGLYDAVSLIQNMVTGSAAGLIVKMLLLSLEGIYSSVIEEVANRTGVTGVCVTVVYVPMPWPPFFMIIPPIVTPVY